MIAGRARTVVLVTVLCLATLFFFSFNHNQNTNYAERAYDFTQQIASSHVFSQPPAEEKPLVPEISSSTIAAATAHAPSATHAAAKKPKPSSIKHESTTEKEQNAWAFNVTKDRKNYGLDEEQCNVAFPGLFDELDTLVKNVRKFKPNGRLTPQDIDLGWKDQAVMRLLIYDKELYVLEEKNCWMYYETWGNRAFAVISQIYRALTAFPGPLPNIEFSICMDDACWGDSNDEHAIWSVTRGADKPTHWMMPTHGFWGWPNDEIGSFAQNLRLIEDREKPFEDKIKKVIWRGDVALHRYRPKLVEAAKGKSWSDVKGVDWTNKGKDFIKMADHCQYQYVLNTEGWASSDRLKYLHQCHSVVIVPEPYYLEPQFALMVFDGPDQNVLRIKPDYSDIDEKVSALVNDPKKAKMIADNNIKTFRDRYLTPAATACYWRQMIRSWASVAWEPELYGPMPVTNMETCEVETKTSWRGRAWETYMITKETMEHPRSCVPKEERERLAAEAKKKEEDEKKQQEDEKKKVDAAAKEALREKKEKAKAEKTDE